MADMTLGEAAKVIGVSVDPLRRWDRAGKLFTTRDSGNRRRVPPSEIQRLTQHPQRHETGDTLSARNRFPGIVRSVEADPDYTNRPEPETTLEALRKVVTG